MTYPSGRVVTYTYDDAGRPSSLAGTKPGDTPANYASSMTYAPHGAMGQLKLGNDVWETSAYNSRLQPSSMVTGTTQGGSNLLSLAFGYGTSNNNGNVLSQTITMPKQASGTLTVQHLGCWQPNTPPPPLRRQAAAATAPPTTLARRA